MKTTYQSKNNSSRSEVDTFTTEQAPDGSALVDMYLTLKKTSDKVNSKAIKDVSVGAEESIEKSYDQALKKEKPSKKKKGSKAPIVLCAIMFIVIVGFIGYTAIQKNNEKKLMAEYDAFVSTVSTLYTQLETTDEVNTQDYRDVLTAYSLKGIDTSDVMSELDTIDGYVSDRIMLKSLSKPDVNMLSKGYQDILDEVDASSNYYSVASLRVSIKDLIKEAENAISEYENLKDAMLADTEFNSSKYQERVDAIVQDIQRNELNAIARVKESEIAYANAVAHLEEVNVPVENEGVKDSKLTKAQREERKAAIEARDLAVEEATVDVEECDNARYEAYCSLYTIQDTMNGTQTLNDYVASWEEAHKVDESEESAE